MDMERANKIIVRERHPIPTVEELLLELNGSTMFLQAGLKWVFYQIILNEESRPITTFVTHRGVHKYKRLMFGLSSGREKYQNVISDALKNYVGVANIADNIIVYGKGQKEHDENLILLCVCKVYVV